MKTRRERSKRFLQFKSAHPCCCFCGGKSPTETIDHVPPKIMFKLKRRPSGLEFPACYRCNEMTSSHELVAAMLTRVFPDPKIDDEKKELKKILRDVDRNRHGILQEMKPSSVQKYDFYNSMNPDVPKNTSPLNVNGLMLNQSIQIFGAKLCYALHYHHRNLIVPIEGSVAIKWYTNWDSINKKIPEELLSLFDSKCTLKQGAWEVKDQFSYSYILPDDTNESLFFATFNFSFSIVGIVSHHKSPLPEINDLLLHRPGEQFIMK